MIKVNGIVLTLILCAVNPVCYGGLQKGAGTVELQTVTLYPPRDKVTGKYDESRACFSFRLGTNKQPGSIDCDLRYGFVRIADEDWLSVSSVGNDKRTVMREIGKFDWSDSFKLPVLEPLPELQPGEKREITVDSSADTHKQWASSTTLFAKAKVRHLYLVHVKDAQADVYALFRIEDLEQGDHCTIAWKIVPPPDR